MTLCWPHGIASRGCDILFALCSGSIQKHSNPVYLYPDDVRGEAGKKVPIDNNDNAVITGDGNDNVATTSNGEEESVTEEFGVDL